MRYEFVTPEPPRIRGAVASGRIEIETAEVGETVVEVEAVRGDLDNLRVEQHGREIVIERRKRFGIGWSDEFEIRIRAPHRADLELSGASADVRVAGRLATVEINTASGDVQVAAVERDAKVRSASGDVQLGTVGGRVDVTSASGGIDVRSAAEGGTVRSASGDVRIGEAGRRMVVQTGSGDQMIESVADGSIELKSASGDLRLGIRRGSRLHVDARSLSGETSSEVELDGAETESEGPFVEVKAATMSGDIRIVRA